MPLVDTLNEGEIVLSAKRSGGSFDPLGCRMVDVCRRQDLREVVRTLPGRWVMLTLTVDRSMWTCPAAAYQRCNERVRKVMADVAPSGVWFAAFEVQTKTGEGWPHWHAVAWVPDGRSADELKRAAVQRWTVRTEEDVDRETGEVLRMSSIERIGFVDVSEAREAVAVGSYIAKYITKPWDAVPAWMGEGRKRLRKVRAAPKVYEILEKLGRHEVHRGSRKEKKGTGRRSRKLFERMARSGAEMTAFRRVGGRLLFAGMVRMPMEDGGYVKYGGRFLRLGKLAACRYVMDGPAFEQLKRLEVFYDGRSAEYVRRRLVELRAAWSEQQERREGEVWTT